jgi:hypothetical protein
MLGEYMDRGFFTMRPCAFRDVQAVEGRSRHAFPRHTHDGYGIGLIVSGAHRSWSGRGMVEAGRGNIITCNPGEVHDGIPIGDTRAWKMLYLAPQVVGAIVPVLEKFSPTSEAFHVYYPARSMMPGKLRVFLDFMRDVNRAG